MLELARYYHGTSELRSLNSYVKCAKLAALGHVLKNIEYGDYDQGRDTVKSICESLKDIGEIEVRKDVADYDFDTRLFNYDLKNLIERIKELKELLPKIDERDQRYVFYIGDTCSNCGTAYDRLCFLLKDGYEKERCSFKGKFEEGIPASLEMLALNLGSPRPLCFQLYNAITRLD